ncbi:hypothetical protein CIPAW_14G131500 [Carya illinoinensis]|uniref:AAA+ ATPase domain-containing protein n=1 Tax=Carya illinoinensis TaxID=32201 RepID=A0A8T1NE66_CARIL|nr:hypothetical protein CIPAW_14G131500 [Carya illinoinensis]
MIFYNYTMLNILIHDNQTIVGINSRVEEMMNLLHMESNDVRFLGIHGMGGVGKTTLAEIIYYRFSCRFEGSSFISCTGERSTTAHDLASLQKQLLSMIMQQEIHIWDHRDGIMLMRNRLRNKKVLIILDDVDCEKLLSALAGDRKWFGPGSRVIITCRDSHLLITHGVNDIYNVELLGTADALQLFSLSAFDKTNPPENYKYLSMNFVHYAGGLPLALKVLGRFLFGRTIDAWKSARDQLQANPNKEIFDILKISFDWLEESQKKLFLDLACLYLIRPFLNLYDFKEIYPAIDFEVLADKSLLSKSDYDKGYLKMHDLLAKMGQEIVRREDPEEPGRRSRLCCQEDVLHVLEKDTGTDAIEVIAVHFGDLPDEAEDRIFNINAKALSKMRKLRLLHIDYSLKYMSSDKLQFQKWFDCPSKSWPSSFQPKGLVVLSMPHSRFKRLWKGLMVLDNLKIINLSFSYSLIKILNLSGAPKLEKINLTRCHSLHKVHSSIGTLRRLQKLQMPGTKIKQLWKGMLVEFMAYETSISQIPSINLIPKSIRCFELEGGKRMPRESRDLVMFNNDCSLPKQSSYPTNHDIGSPVEYETEEKFSVQLQCDDDIGLWVSIKRCSLGSRIPEWVHNKSNGSSLFFDMCNGSSLKIDSDGNTMSVMGIAFFIVCQFHSITPVNLSRNEIVTFPIWLDDDARQYPFLQFWFTLSTDVILDKPIVLCKYFWDPENLGSWRLKRLDKRKISTAAKFNQFHGQTSFMEVEVKEWGLHLVCPDDAALGLESDLDSFVDFINLGLETQHDRNED